MKFLKTKPQRLSARLTALISILLLLLIFVVGPSYMDPPLEYGVAVNFGNSDVGNGPEKPSLPPQPNQTSTTENQDNTPLTQTEKIETEDVLTDESSNQTLKTSENVNSDTTQETLEASKEEDQKQKEIELQNKKKKELDALMSGIGGKVDTHSDSEGDDLAPGDKGQQNGERYAPSYFGVSGEGSGGVGYGLNGRGEPTANKFIPDCDEEGRVVVEIYVNRAGEVVSAVPGKKGTTGDSCLFEAAKQTALTYRWPSDDKAPVKQIGFVIIDFSVRQ